MKKHIIFSVPTAKIQIGNQAAITLDTASHQGKKSYRIEIVSENDTITKEIDEVVKEVNSEIANEVEKNFCTTSEVVDKVTPKTAGDVVLGVVGSVAPMLILVLPALFVFAYLAYRSKQNRLWKESLLSKGHSVDEIEKLTLDKKDTTPTNLDNYEKRKSLKYAIVFGAVGISILMGTVMDSGGYFFGTLFLLLGIGFWFFQEKIK